jgi:hypothetical protein
MVKCKWVYKTKLHRKVLLRYIRLTWYQRVFSISRYRIHGDLCSCCQDVLCLNGANGCFGWGVHQMVVKSAFLHEILLKISIWSNKCYCGQDKTLICKLKKSMYFLKHAPLAWYEKIDSSFI